MEISLKQIVESYNNKCCQCISEELNSMLLYVKYLQWSGMKNRNNVVNKPARRSSSATRKCGPSCHHWKHWLRVWRNAAACVVWLDCGHHQVDPLLPETVYQGGISCLCPSSHTSVCDQWIDAAVQLAAGLHISLLLAYSCRQWKLLPSCLAAVRNNPSFDDPFLPLSDTTHTLHLLQMDPCNLHKPTVLYTKVDAQCDKLKMVVGQTKMTWQYLQWSTVQERSTLIFGLNSLWTQLRIT